MHMTASGTPQFSTTGSQLQLFLLKDESAGLRVTLYVPPLHSDGVTCLIDKVISSDLHLVIVKIKRKLMNYKMKKSVFWEQNNDTAICCL